MGSLFGSQNDSQKMDGQDGGMQSPLLSAVSDIITSGLLADLMASYQMNWNGIHGFDHWCRVRENGLYLADLNGANTKVIEYFAFFHDNQRHNDSIDPFHGRRASELIRAGFINRLDLTPEEINLLCEACDGHTHGHTKAELTVQVCWDADRLDLMRVNIMPQQRYLCTSEAKQPEVIEWAVNRSLAWVKSRKG
jgi:uncharacterized protein